MRSLLVLWADGAYLSESLAAWLLGHFGWQLVVTHLGDRQRTTRVGRDDRQMLAPAGTPRDILIKSLQTPRPRQL